MLPYGQFLLGVSLTTFWREPSRLLNRQRVPTQRFYLLWGILNLARCDSYDMDGV